MAALASAEPVALGSRPAAQDEEVEVAGCEWLMPERDFCRDCFDTCIKIGQISLPSGRSLKNNGTAVRSAAFSVVVNFGAALMIQRASVVYIFFDFFDKALLLLSVCFPNDTVKLSL